VSILKLKADNYEELKHSFSPFSLDEFDCVIIKK